MNSIECEGVVEEITNFLDGALAADRQDAVAGHLGVCWGCEKYVGQVQATNKLMAELPVEPLPSALERALLAGYREWVASARE